MSEPIEPAEVATAWFACLAAGHPGEELCDPDIRIANPAGFPDTGPYDGLEGLRRWWDDLTDAVDAMHVESESIEEIGEGRFLTTQRLVGRFRSTGIALDAPWIALIKVRGGLVTSARGFGSRQAALQALER